MVKPLNNLLFRNQKADDLKTWNAVSGAGVHDDPGLKLIYFTARSNLVPYAFVWEKGKPINLSETIVRVVVYDVSVGICSN